MTRFYITFSGRAYDDTTATILDRAPGLGADKVIVYDDKWLSHQPFYQQNQWLWNHHGDQCNHPRGFGWFAWKPFILLHTLMNYCERDDIVLFTDADTVPIQSFGMLYEECNRIGGTMLFGAAGCQHEHWCKRDTFVVMGQDLPVYRFVPHAVARFMLFQAGKWSGLQLLMEWLTYCLNPLANTFDKSVILPEYSELREPRCEQAILTNLAYKYGHKLYREACAFGNALDQDRNLYPQLFEQISSSGPKWPLGSRYANVV